jgi:hypothetical protein
MKDHCVAKTAQNRYSCAAKAECRTTIIPNTMNRGNQTQAGKTLPPPWQAASTARRAELDHTGTATYVLQQAMPAPKTDDQREPEATSTALAHVVCNRSSAVLVSVEGGLASRIGQHGRRGTKHKALCEEEDSSYAA